MQINTMCKTEKPKGKNLTLILPGQCISLFPNVIRIEDIGSDVDI